MKKEKVLLIEDAKDMQMIVQSTIGSFCEVHCAPTLAEAREILQTTQFDLLLLDVSLPDGDGFEFCKTLREESKFAEVPLIFLTAEKETGRKVLGFSLGADDYVTKPIDPAEFSARVTAKLRRRKTSATEVQYASLKVDLNSQKAVAADRELSLTPIEFKLLVFFVKNAEKVVAREKLFTAVWGGAVHVSGHTVDTHISSLRKKLADSDCALVSIPKKGYRLASKQAQEN